VHDRTQPNHANLPQLIGPACSASANCRFLT
jgi:hypothetical protein